MAKEDLIEMSGEVIDTMPNTTFKVKLKMIMSLLHTFLKDEKTTYVF